MALGAMLWASGADMAIQAWLWGHYGQGFNTAMRILGEMGKGSFEAGVCLLAGLAALALARWKDKGDWSVAAYRILAAIPVFALAGVVNWILKWGIGRPRPKEWLMNGLSPWDVHPFTMKATWWSFPSGHSCSTFAIAVWLALAFPRWRAPLLAVAVVMSFSRFLAITPHYSGDVVAGAGVGAAVAGWLWYGWQNRKVLPGA